MSMVYIRHVNAGYAPTYSESIWHQFVIAIKVPTEVWSPTAVRSTL